MAEVSLQAVQERIQREGIQFVDIQAVDLTGRLRRVTLPSENLDEATVSGGGQMMAATVPATSPTVPGGSARERIATRRKSRRRGGVWKAVLAAFAVVTVFAMIGAAGAYAYLRGVARDTQDTSPGVAQVLAAEFNDLRGTEKLSGTSPC